MFNSPGSIAGWVLSILVVTVMGVLAFHGNFHNVNKVQAQLLPAVSVSILTNLQTQGDYRPATVTVKPGQPVTFKNVSNAIHTAQANDGHSFDSGNIGQGRQVTIIAPSKPGTYRYFCAYHALMHGTLVVQ